MADQVIGRGDELLALAAFVESVPDCGQALVLEGEAGIGKTALWQQGLCLAHERGFRVLRSRSSTSETQLAFATIGDLFAPVVDEMLARLAPLQRRALEAALLIRGTEWLPLETRVLGLALVSVVHALAQEGPLLVAIDDVQWVDASSAEVLTFTLRRLEGEPVGVLATARGRPVQAPFELDRGYAGFRRLSVEPLSVGAIHRLLWGRLGLTLSRPTLIRVYETTGGNPFFALELGRGIVDGSIRADSDDGSLPESLRAVVAHRLGALPARVADTLVAVAALAAPSVTVLEPFARTAVDDIEVAVERGVLELDGDRIRFTHPLLAPACYAAMPLHRRRRVHRRLADLNVDPEERARHLAIAACGVDEEIAAALDAASAHARRRGATQAAAELAERAVALTPVAAAEDIGRRRITAAGLCADAGDTIKARVLLEEVAASAAPGPLRSEGLFQLAEVRAASDGNPIALELLALALAEPGVDSRQKATILGSLASKASVGGDSRSGARYAEAGLVLAEELAEPEVLMSSLTTLAEITFWRTGRICRDLLDRAIEIHRGIDGERTGDPRATLAHQLGRAERFAESRAIWEALIAECAVRDDPQLGTCMCFQARMEVGSGRWDTAARLCDEATEVSRQTGWEVTEPLCRMIHAEIDAYRGETEASSRTISALLLDADRFGYGGATHRLNRAFASLELSRDDPRAAWGQVAPLFDGVEELDEVVAQLAGSVAIEALIAIGDFGTAERLLTLLDERTADSDTALLSFAHRCRGLLLEARGDLEGAIVELEVAAVEPDAPQGINPFELARTLLILGRVRRKARHKRAARETLERALEIFERLGARGWADNTRSELRRIGGRTASDSQLSETERRIVELVVAGRRNREVADALNLSPNTIAWNLSKVYRKLGVTSRTELTAHIAASPPL